MNVTNTGQGELHLHIGQNIGIVDLRSVGYWSFVRKTYGDACSKMGKVSNSCERAHSVE